MFVAVCAWLLPGVSELREDDDVLAFLPQEDPDVVGFNEVAARFGMLELVLVGLEVPEGTDLYAPEQVDAVRALSARIAELEGVRLTLSFVDLPHPKVDDAGLEVAPLVPEGLRDAAAIEARVKASPDAVGNLISADGRAATILVYLAHATGDARTALRGQVLGGLREVVDASWTGTAHLGGAVVMEDEGARASRRDLERLSPVVIAALVIASAVLLRSVVAAILNLILAGLGVGLVMGTLGTFDEPLSIVSSTTPVMMVALGGAFGVHMLSGYRRQGGHPAERASATLRELWGPVSLSGITTSISFFALLAMPQVPMQRFGVVAGCGVLLLLLLALFVLPALLSLLPARALPVRPEPAVRLRGRPPAWLLVVLALSGAGAATTLQADPDTTSVFDPESAPRRADAFFAREFGGSVFLQVAVQGDLREPAVLRRVRDLSEEVAALEGVVDVRSVVEPFAILNHALGGRRGIPETKGRATRVMTYLVGHPAMAQLMTETGDAALVHVRLGPMDGAQQVDLTREIERRAARAFPESGLHVVPAATVADGHREDVRRRLERLVGRPVDGAALERGADRTASPELLAAVRAVRDRALASDDSPVEGVPAAEIEAVDPAALVTPRGADLEALLKAKLPTLVATDPEGIHFVAEHLGPWVDEAIAAQRGRGRCRALELDDGACDRLEPALSELEDLEWTAPQPGSGDGARTVPAVARVTGQPVIGRAFGDAVTRSLWEASAVSILALGLILWATGFGVALIPAVWTLAFTAGAIAILGHPISLGTTMVACIALGCGVDFAIHLGVRAKRLGGDHPGVDAVDALGHVALISALQLSAAFLVLLLSAMPPLRQFGVGLAIGLCGAALGAVWLVPMLYRRPSK